MTTRAALLSAALLVALLPHGGRCAWAEDEPPLRPDALVVLDVDGKPVSGALVVATAVEIDERFLFDADASVVAQSGPDGRVESIPAGAGRLVVWAHGYAAVLVPASAFETEVRLVPARSVDGVVRFSRGAPARGVAILAVPAGDHPLVHRVRSDAEGRYAFEALPQGQWLLHLRRGDGRLQSLGEVSSGDDAPDVVLVGSASVRGKLLDGDGVSGAVAADIPLRFVPMPGGAPGAASRESRAGPDGRFLVGDLDRGMYRLEIISDEWEFDQEPPRIEVRRGRTQTLRPWFVRRRVPIIGQVVDPDRKPIVGATVRLLRESPDDPDAERAALSVRPARTIGDGHFRLSHVSPGDGYRLVVTAVGYAPWISSRFRVGRREPARLLPSRLVPGWRLAVRVLDHVGKPIAGAAVRATPTTHPAQPEDRVRSAFVRRATTDAEGRAVLVDLLEADAKLRVSVRGRLDHELLVPAPLAGRHRSVDVSLVPAERLTGRVATNDARTGGPYRVRAVFADGADSTEVSTDALGGFVFDTLRPVATVIEVRGAGKSALVLGRRDGLLPGTDEHVEIVLPPLASISGYVSGLSAGVRAVVVLEAPERDARLERFRWRTIASVLMETRRPGEGSFEFEQLPPGPYAVRAIQGGRDSSALSVRLQEGSIEDLELQLPAGARIAGTVLDAADAPVPGAAIVFERVRGEGDAPGRPGGPLRTTTDTEGGYVMTGLAPGLWRVIAQLPRRADAIAEVRVGEGDVLVVEDLRLAVGASVEGRVRAADDQAMDGAALRLRRRDRAEVGRVVYADEEGAYRFAFVPPGLYVLTLETETRGAVPQTAVEVAGTETVRVDFEGAGRGRIEGTVRRGGRRVAGALIELISEPEAGDGAVRRYRAHTASDGTFGWDALERGLYRLELRYGSARTAQPVFLEDGDRVTVDVAALEARLVGNVESRSGGPVSGAEVTARAIDMDAQVVTDGVVARGRTDPQGHFVLSGLPVGWFRLEVEAPGLPPGVLAMAEAELAGAERGVTVVMGRGGDLSLTVVDAVQRGVTGARIWIEDETGVPFHSQPYVTGPGGRLLVEGIPAGDVRIRVQARGFGRPPIYGASISEGGHTPLRIPLRAPGTLVVTVHGAGRDPVTRARIDILREGTDDVVERRRPLGRVRLDPRWGYVPKTGRLVIDALEPGAYVVVIDAGATYPIRRVGVDVGAGQVTEARIELGGG